MSEHDDRAVAAGLRAGDAGAWQAFYDAHAGRLWQSVARRIGPAADVADVVQETLLAAARNARQYDSTRGSLWNWLWGIGHRQVALYYRKRGRHPLAADEAEPVLNWLDGRELAPVHQAVRREWAGLVRQVLASLPAEYDELLTAFYLDGSDVDALARLSRSTPVAVRSKLARARAAFRISLLQLIPCAAEEHHDTAGS
jgi:RNA polymerase sigma-70 factor (ECF subfamily)